MKFIARLLLIGLLSYFAPMYFPWWICIVVAALVGYLIPGNGLNVFNAGFLGGGIVWLSYAFVLDARVSSFLSEKIAAILTLSDPTYLIIIAGLIGALACGLGAQTGNSFRQIFIKKKQVGFYS